jgi:hypothetical protein
MLGAIEGVDAFYDLEDIIAKVQAIHESDRTHRYGAIHQPNTFWERIRAAAESVPQAHRSAALALFANVVYLTGEVLEESARTIAFDLSQYCNSSRASIPSDIHLFATDHPGLVDQFYEAGGPYGWTGRSDQLSQRNVRSVSALLERLEELIKGPSDGAFLNEILRKPIWILLTDNVLSGGSLKSDVVRLGEIAELFAPKHRITLLVGALVITRQAIHSLAGVISRERLIFGLSLDDRFRISSDSCELFNSYSTLQQVRSFCGWFGDTFFPSQLPLPLQSMRSLRRPRPGTPARRGREDGQSRMAHTLNLHRQIGGLPNFAYGWLDCGYTLVTQRNAPTNSVPAIWYPVLGEQLPLEPTEYAPPFPRNHSREISSTYRDSERLDRIRRAADTIRLHLSQASGA